MQPVQTPPDITSSSQSLGIAEDMAGMKVYVRSRHFKEYEIRKEEKERVWFL
jgi:hypothetical protein